MRKRRLLARVVFYSGLAILASWIPTASRLTAASSLRQAETLAGLAGRIIGCSVHPCLGDCATKTRATLQGKLVNDGFFDYSDLATSYPEVRGILQGVIEWNLEGTLDDVSLIVVDFQADPAVLKLELQRTLPGCDFEDDSEDEQIEAEVDESGGTTTEWTCAVHPEGRDEVGITVHLAPELVYLEIES